MSWFVVGLIVGGAAGWRVRRWWTSGASSSGMDDDFVMNLRQSGL